jgi:hypothetical protein
MAIRAIKRFHRRMKRFHRRIRDFTAEHAENAEREREVGKRE